MSTSTSASKSNLGIRRSGRQPPGISSSNVMLKSLNEPVTSLLVRNKPKTSKKTTETSNYSLQTASRNSVQEETQSSSHPGTSSRLNEEPNIEHHLGNMSFHEEDEAGTEESEHDFYEVTSEEEQSRSKGE